MNGTSLIRQLFANFVGISCFLSLFLGLGTADVPEKINYQGYLTDASGIPVNGTRQMTFTIYDQPMNGNALWTETQNPALIDGIYNVRLGEVEPITLAFSIPYYLGVRIGSDPEMTPRQPLLTVGYAFRAKYANEASGFALPFAGSTAYTPVSPNNPIAFSVIHTSQGVAAYFETNSTQGTNNTGDYPAVGAFSHGSGDAVIGVNYGTGEGGKFEIINPGNSDSALHGRSNGSGDAVRGTMTGTGYAGYFNGNVYITGNLHKGGGYFVQPHPQDPRKELSYAFFEGPEHAVFLRGKAKLVNGKAVIEPPEYWRMVAGKGEDINVQFTPRSSKSKGLAAVEVTREKIVIEELMEGSGTYEFDYFITAKRAGFEKHEPIQTNTHFKADNMTKEEFEQRYAKTDDITILAIRNLLISNGILTKDGELNTETARKLGWQLKPGKLADLKR